MQGEYIHSDVHQTAGGNADLEGYYVQAGYFLTGEHRGYKRSTKSFGRTKVIEPFFRVRTAEGICSGKGAWEVAYRYAKGDLIDAGITGGVIQSHTIGLNWHLNNYTRFMFNYVHATDYFTPVSTSPGGSANGFGLRFQVDF
jgi:phosphate-selective porin OprO/OprP